MKALVCEAPFALAVAERGAPTRPPGWAGVAPSYVGICETDCHIYEGLHPFLGYPLVIGHEVAGTVTEAPPGGSLRVGQRVVVNPYLSCGSCRAGKPNCCVAIKVLGVHMDGAMAGDIVLPASNLYPADELSSRDAALVEFLAIGAHALRRGAVVAGARVAVIGVGPIGFGIALFANLRGANVTLIDLKAARLAFAKDLLGAVHTLLASDSLAGEAEAATGGDFFDILFDASGNKVSMENGFQLVGSGGAYVLVSVVKDRVSFADPLFHSREMTLFGSRNATRENFDTVMKAMKEGRVPTDRLNTHTADLADAPAAIPSWLKTPDKAIIRVGG